MDKQLLALLGCPVDKSELELQGNTLVCPICGRVYRIVEGIPQMLIGDYLEDSSENINIVR